ncbi:MAG TPA: ATP-binding protein [Polyangia bacterium]|nr:ATP-binding protein [Polyangia bacterium]
MRRQTSDGNTIESLPLDAANDVGVMTHDLAARVLAGMPGALLVVTAEGLVEAAFARCELLGATPASVVGKPVHEVLGIPDDGAAGLVQLWIASVVGQDTGAWDIYADQAPRRATHRSDDGAAQYYAIDCSPLVAADGLVERIMLHVRPEVAGGEGATTQAVTTAGPTPEQLELFACEATGLVADCQSAFERLVADPAARHAVHHLFRSLHTLKGTARAFGIATVQEAAHAAEDYLSTVRASAEPVDPEKLAAIDAHLSRVRAGVTASAGKPNKQATDVRYREEIDRLIDALDDVAERMSGEALDELAGRVERIELDDLRRALVAARDPNDGAARTRLAQLARQLKPLVRELRECPLPRHYLAEAERCLADAQNATDASARASALAALTACAASLGVDSVRSIARRAERDHEAGAPIALALDELNYLQAMGRALQPHLSPRTRVDALGLFHEEARRLLSQMERALADWQAHPRGKEGLQAVKTLSDQVALYRACARRFQLTALMEQVQDVDQMLQEARKSERPQRSLAARVEQWIAELDSHLRLYQTFQVELRATGARSEEHLRALHGAAARTGGSPDERTAALATIAAMTYEAGLLSVGAALAEATPVAETRVLRLCTDAVGLTVEATPPPKPLEDADRARAVSAAARTFEEALLGSDGQTLATSWHALRRSIDRLGRRSVASLAERLARTIAEAAREVGKEVVLEVDGDEVEADEPGLRRLGEILLHAARNAVDHGIETPEQREAAGKPTAGTIALKARLYGKRMRIELRDDGRGVDLARVRGKAVQSGRLRADAVMSDRELIELLFEPGFSTAESVTLLSGRGVGMDVVRAIAVEAGGSAHLESTPGRGSRLVVDMPFTSRESRPAEVDVDIELELDGAG